MAGVGTPIVPDCTELGRVSRSFCSGYTAARTETRRIRRYAKRCILADFNGALPAGELIASVRWDTTSPWSVFMSNARVITGQRKVAVDAAFNFAGWGAVLATVTTVNGDTYNQDFNFTVLDRPLYPGAVYNSANGPFNLEAVA